MKSNIFLCSLIFLMVCLTVWLMPPAVNIYKDVDTDQIIRIETKGQCITDPVKIAEVLSGRYDGEVFYLRVDNQDPDTVNPRLPDRELFRP